MWNIMLLDIQKTTETAPNPQYNPSIMNIQDPHLVSSLGGYGFRERIGGTKRPLVL